MMIKLKREGEKGVKYEKGKDDKREKRIRESEKRLKRGRKKIKREFK